MDIVKVVVKGNTGEYSSREYSYYSEESLEIGTIVKVPMGNSMISRYAKVVVNHVPESDVELFKDVMKTIPAGSKIVRQPKLGEEVIPPWEVEDKKPDIPWTEADEKTVFDDAPDAVVPKEEQPITAITALQYSPDSDRKYLHFSNEVAKIVDFAKMIEVVSHDTEKDATDDLTLIKELTKEIDGTRKSIVSPINDVVNTINQAFRKILDPLKEADGILRKKVVQYKQDVERQIREAEETNRMAQEVARRQAEHNFGEFTVDTTPVQAPITAKTTRATVGTSSLTETWKYRVVDFDKVPREYLVVDDAMLSTIAKKHHDKKPVPGIEFYPENGLQVRKK
jgi:hypothetical protein